MPVVRVAIIALVVGIRLLLKQDWIGNALLVGGWLIGYALAEADDWFYMAMCNPQELTCQRVRTELSRKNFRGARDLLKTTAAERTKLPVHNMLTVLAISAAGIWLVTSGGNLLAIGVVLGLGIRLFSDFWQEADFGKWYWLFARQFSNLENRLVKIVWGILLLTQVLFLIRG